jgi:hypothetical protein
MTETIKQSAFLLSKADANLLDIDWHFWRSMPQVKQWQACALSLNINPDVMKSHPQGWMTGSNEPIFASASFPDDATATEFKKRCRMLAANLTNSQYFQFPHIQHKPTENTEVKLSAFSAWCKSVQLSMPDELSSISNTPTNQGVARNDEMPKSPREFRPWETYDFLPDGCFVYHQAAREIADALNWSDEKLTGLLAEMAQAINEKALPTVSRKTGLRVLGERPEFLGLVTMADVNKWLEARGATYSWERPAKKEVQQAEVSTNAIQFRCGIESVAFDDLAILLTDAQWYGRGKSDGQDVELSKQVDRIAHGKALHKAVEKQVFVVRDSSTFLPIQYATQIETGRISVSDFSEYAKKLGVVVSVAEAQELSEVPVSQVTPMSRHRAQEQTILNAITNLKLDPLNLPANDAGRPGVKAKVRKALGTSQLFTGSTVFDKAWERLTLQQDIKIQERLSP